MTHRQSPFLGAVALILGATCIAACDDQSHAAKHSPQKLHASPTTSAVAQPREVPQDALAAMRRAGFTIAPTNQPAEVSAQDAIAQVRAEMPETSVRAKQITASLAHVWSKKDRRANRPGFVDELTWIVVLHDVPSASYSNRIDDPHPIRTGPVIPFVVAFVSPDTPARFLARSLYRPLDQRS